MTGTETPRIVVFDVCDTLYDANTTFEYVRSVKSDRGWFRLLDRLLSHRASPVFWGLAVLYRLGRIDIPRRVMIASLKGMDRETLRRAARAYVAGPLSACRIAETHTRLRRHAEAGDRIVLISNSLDVVIEAIAADLGVEWRASRLAFHGERCAGRIADDLTGRKLDVARALSAEGGAEMVVYTDNLSDRPLVEAADTAVVVIPPRADRAAWRGVTAEYLVLGP